MFMERSTSEDVQGMWLAKRYTRDWELGLGLGLERTLILIPKLHPNPNQSSPWSQS